eukprot:scaffold21150_cov129-Isochrysis_galbana.AAC.5
MWRGRPLRELRGKQRRAAGSRRRVRRDRAAGRRPRGRPAQAHPIAPLAHARATSPLARVACRAAAEKPKPHSHHPGKVRAIGNGRAGGVLRGRVWLVDRRRRRPGGRVRRPWRPGSTARGADGRLARSSLYGHGTAGA